MHCVVCAHALLRTCCLMMCVWYVCDAVRMICVLYVLCCVSVYCDVNVFCGVRMCFAVCVCALCGVCTCYVQCVDVKLCCPCV